MSALKSRCQKLRSRKLKGMKFTLCLLHQEVIPNPVIPGKCLRYCERNNRGRPN